MTDKEKIALAERVLREEIGQLERWARESETGGWSTHQVKPMRNRALALAHVVLDLEDGPNALRLSDEQLSALDDALNYYAHCGYGTGYSPAELHDADDSVLDETQCEHVALMRQVYTIVLDAQEAAVRRAV